MNRKGKSVWMKSFESIKKGIFALVVPMSLLLSSCGENTGYEEEMYDENEVYGPATRGTEEDTSAIQNRDEGVVKGNEEEEINNTEPERFYEENSEEGL